MAAEDDVRKTSERFSGALDAMANGDGSRCDDVWSHSDDVTAMRPIGGRHSGAAPRRRPAHTLSTRR